MGEQVLVNPIAQAMKKVGDSNRYQIIVIIIFAVIWFEAANILIGSSFIFMNPVFKCDATGDEQINENQACRAMDQKTDICIMTNDYTIVGYLKLYCDRQFERSVVQSFLAIGSIVGLLSMNTLCDIKGRKFAILSSLGSACIGFGLLILSTYLDVIPVMIISQVLVGFGGYSLAIISYVVYYDICSDSLRQSAMISMNIVWGLSQMLFFVWDRYYHRWDLFIITVMLIPTILVMVFTLFFFVQCPNFLLDSKKDPQSCIKSLQYIGKINKKSQIQIQQAKKIIEDYTTDLHEINKQKNMGKQVEEKSNNFLFIIKKLFCQWYYFKPVVILTVVYFAASLYYYGMQFSIDDIGYAYSINMIFLGAVEAAGFIILQLGIKYIKKTPRKLGVGILYFIAGILSLLTFIPAVKDSEIAVTIIIAGSRLFTTLAYGFFIFIQTESFSSDIQSTGAGLIQGLSQLGSFFCPYVIQLLTVLEVYPIKVLSIILIIFAVFPTIGLRQTVKRQPQKTKHQQEIRQSLLTQEQLSS